MTIFSGAAEVLHIANKPGLTEFGGGHGAKGVDFQRWWSIPRMVELEHSVPEPGTMWLLGLGLVGIELIRRRKWAIRHTVWKRPAAAGEPPPKYIFFARPKIARARRVRATACECLQC